MKADRFKSEVLATRKGPRRAKGAVPIQRQTAGALVAPKDPPFPAF